MKIGRGVSRRDFFKLTLTGLIGSFLAASERLIQPTEAAAPTLTVTLTNTNIPEPAASTTDTPEPPTATPTELTCLRLLTPENGAKLEAMGRVTFSWEPMPDAAVYRLEITLPTGQMVSFDTNGVSREQYLEALRMAGVYYWQVSALGGGGGLMCTSEAFTFEKEESAGKNDGGGGDTTGGGPGESGGPGEGG